MDNKEIDLLDVIKKIVLFFRKNLWFFLILSIIGAGVGFGYNKTQKSVFSSKGAFMSWLEPDILTLLLDAFEQQKTDNNNYIDISETDNTPINTKQRIISFEYDIAESTALLTSDKTAHFVENKTLVHIEVIARDIEVLDKFENFIINFFNNNETVKERHIRRQEILKSLLEDINYELEAHKKRNDLLINQSSKLNTLFLSGYSIISMLDIRKLKNEIENELDNAEIICFVLDFTEPIEERTPILKTILMFVVFSIIVGIIYKLIKTI